MMRQVSTTFRSRRNGTARRCSSRLMLSVVATCVVALVAGAATLLASSSKVIPASPLSVALKYTGGKKGAANPKAAPVVIGFVVDEAPATTHPGNIPAARAAVALINQNLGGIRGRPLKLALCSVKQSEADGATCALEMINNRAVNVVVASELKTGEASFIATMAGTKPVLGVFTNGPGLRAKNTFYTNGAVQAQLAAVAYIAKVLGAGSVSILGPDIPGVSTALGRFATLFGAHKVTSKVVLYPASATDLVAPIAASGAQNSDAILVVASTQANCVAIGKAFAQMGIDRQRPVVTPTPACLDLPVKESLGDNPKWHYVFTTSNPLAPYRRATAVAAYVEATKAYGNTDLLVNGYAPQTFGAILTIAKWLNELGPANATSEAIAQKLASFTGPMFMGDPKIKFGQDPFPTIGSVRALIYEYLGNGRFFGTTKGRWLCPPNVPNCTE